MEKVKSLVCLPCMFVKYCIRLQAKLYKILVNSTFMSLLHQAFTLKQKKVIGQILHDIRFAGHVIAYSQVFYFFIYFLLLPSESFKTRCRW